MIDGKCEQGPQGQQGRTTHGVEKQEMGRCPLLPLCPLSGLCSQVHTGAMIGRPSGNGLWAIQVVGLTKRGLGRRGLLTARHFTNSISKGERREKVSKDIGLKENKKAEICAGYILSLEPKEGSLQGAHVVGHRRAVLWGEGQLF